MKTWNDCPLCGKELILYTDKIFVCQNVIESGTHHYQILWLEAEYIFINQYMIVRQIDSFRLSFFPEKNENKLIDCRHPFPLDKFNSKEKIEKLLLLA